MATDDELYDRIWQLEKEILELQDDTKMKLNFIDIKVTNLINHLNESLKYENNKIIEKFIVNTIENLKELKVKK